MRSQGDRRVQGSNGIAGRHVSRRDFNAEAGKWGSRVTGLCWGDGDVEVIVGGRTLVAGILGIVTSDPEAGGGSTANIIPNILEWGHTRVVPSCSENVDLLGRDVQSGLGVQTDVLFGDETIKGLSLEFVVLKRQERRGFEPMSLG